MLQQKAKHVEKPKRKRDEIRVYRPPLRNRVILTSVLLVLLVPVIACPGAFVISLSIGHWRDTLWISPIMYIFGAAFWTFYQGVFANRLEVSPEGIEYHIDGCSGFVFWHDMEQLRFQENAWGITLNRLVSETRSMGRRVFAPGAKARYERFLPLQYFIAVRTRRFFFRVIDLDHFKHTPLGQDLLYYAPHLFEKSKQKAKE